MKAYELLSDESRWARKNYAYEVEGGSCDPRSSNACAWCVLGAIERCYYDDGITKTYLDVMSKLGNRVGNIPCWNDAKGRTYEEVLAVLKELDI